MPHYRTKDLFEASALLTKDMKFLYLEPIENTSAYLFVFEDADKCQEIANSFWSSSLNVDAMKFKNCIRTLKERLFSFQKK